MGALAPSPDARSVCGPPHVGLSPTLPECDGAWLKRLCDICGQAAPFSLVSGDDAIPMLARRRGVEPREIASRLIAEVYSDDVLVEHR